MGCQKTGGWSTEQAALRWIEKLWSDIRAGRVEFRDHTPHAAVWCYAHMKWHVTSNGIKPKGRGKRGRHANGRRAGKGDRKR
jgi:hypothetical protein